MTDQTQMSGSAAASPEKPAGGGVLAFLLSRRLQPVLVLALSLFALYSLFRLGLVIGYYSDIHNVPRGEILRCFGMGLRYDAMPTGYMVLPLALLLSLAPDRWFSRPRMAKFVSLYSTTMVVFVVLIEIIGAAFFAQMGARLNWMTFGYLVHYREVATYLWQNYPVWLVPPAVALVYYGLYRLFRRLFTRNRLVRLSLPGRVAQAVVLSLLCILAARASIESRPFRREAAYFSANNLVSQLTLNNLITLFGAAKLEIGDNRDERGMYPFPDALTAARTAQQLLLQDHDVPLDGPSNPLWRRTASPRRQQDYNVVVIIMEGMSGEPVGALGNSPSHTPNLDEICRRSLYFGRAYAVGARTSRGMVGVLCGHPDIAGTTVMKREKAVGRFLTLPQVLQSRGYRSVFVYGGDPEFDNMKAFFAAGGIERTIGQSDMGSEHGNWGVDDEIMFRKAIKTFDAMESPFLGVVLTVSNHPPYSVPSGRVEFVDVSDDEEINLRTNAYRYADWALGEFFRNASGSPWFERTIFVLVADHGHGMDPTRVIDVDGYRVPLAVYAPGLIPPGRVETVVSQTDIAPTVLGLLGGSYDHCFIGRDALQAGDAGFALLHEDDRLAFVSGDDVLVLRARSQPLLYRLVGGRCVAMPLLADDARVQQMQHKMLSLYMMALELYRKEAYRGEF